MKHKIKYIHFVGIGGVGMSGIAEVLLNLGYTVSGSDIAESSATYRLQQLGATIYMGHSAEFIGKAQVIVTSSAVNPNTPEIVAGREKNIPVVPRAVMLGELMRLKRGIAIAGTHGKTTTTSLIASVLAEGKLDPTFVIGGKLISAGVNAKLGDGEYLVAEADESDASFLNLSPMIEVITNIGADHMDFYDHNFKRLKQAFIDFTQRMPFYGVVMLCIDDPAVREIVPHIQKPLTTYGFHEQAMVKAVQAKAEGSWMLFTILQKGYTPLPIRLPQPGMHNIQNACAAIAIARELHVCDAAIQKGLENFTGVGRRFSRYGNISLKNETGRSTGTFTLVDDYGHHPVEVAATIAAARAAYPGRRLVLVFQPHRYTRTRALFEDFVKVLSTVDVLLLTEIYPAGESPIVAINGRNLAHALRVVGMSNLMFVDNITDIPAAILTIVQTEDVVLTMGAGSIATVPEQLQRIQESSS